MIVPDVSVALKRFLPEGCCDKALPRSKAISVKVP